MRLWSIIGLSVSLWSVSAQSQNPNVVAWGKNDYGQRDVPADATNITAVTAGLFTALGLRTDGTVIAWGDTNYGMCDIPSQATNIMAIAAGEVHVLALRSNGTVISWGFDQNNDTVVPANLSNVVAISAGVAHSLALRADGTMAAWGHDAYGQIDIPPDATNIMAICAGGAHSLALRRDGKVFSWGLNWWGQTNVPSPATNIIAIGAGWSHSIAVRSDGSIIVWGNSGPAPVSATNVIMVSGSACNGGFVGDDYSLALRSDGNVVAWGDNTYGECDIPSNLITNGLAPTMVAAGYGFAVACRQIPQVIINTNPPKNITVIPSTQTVPTEGTIDIRVNAVGTSLTYQWNFGGVPILGATGNTLSITNAQPIQSGTYSCLVSQPGGYAVSPPAQVVVAPVLAEYKASVLSILAEIGWTYDIQYQIKTGSTAVWTNLAEVVITNQPQYYVDYTTINQPLRQYRLVQVSP